MQCEVVHIMGHALTKHTRRDTTAICISEYTKIIVGEKKKKKRQILEKIPQDNSVDPNPTSPLGNEWLFFDMQTKS